MANNLLDDVTPTTKFYTAPGVEIIGTLGNSYDDNNTVTFGIGNVNGTYFEGYVKFVDDGSGNGTSVPYVVTGAVVTGLPDTGSVTVIDSDNGNTTVTLDNNSSATNPSSTTALVVTESNYFKITLVLTAALLAPVTIALSGFIDGTPVCVGKDTMVTMADRTEKLITSIKAGDNILSCSKTNEVNTVKRLVRTGNTGSGYKITSGLIGNTGELVCSDHPIWCNNGKNRMFPSAIKGVEKITLRREDVLYNIQFEKDSSFYANGVKVDSLPPYNAGHRLPKSMYTNPENYSDHVYTGEDDPIRNKPLMTNAYESVDTL